jgi:hypothetical protein
MACRGIRGKAGSIMIDKYRLPFVTTLGLIGLFGIAGCEPKYPDGYLCGKGDHCPPGFFCHNNLCVHNVPKLEEVGGTGGVVSSDTDNVVSTTDGEDPIRQTDAGFTIRTGTSGGGGSANTSGLGGISSRNGSGGSTQNERAGNGFSDASGGHAESAGGADGATGTEIPIETETVTDSATKLTWQKCPPGQSGTKCEAGGSTKYSSWQDALEYCDRLTFANYDDWRLPSIQELATIVDYTKYAPAINTETFPSTAVESVWSSSESVFDNTYAWYVGFETGDISWQIKTTGSTSARCVRGDSWVGKFSSEFKSGERIVHDATTSLTWHGCTAGQTGDDCTSGIASSFSLEQANAFCEGSTLGGYNDWRVPNLRELTTIVDYSRINPATHPLYFPATPQAGVFWTTTSVVGYVGFIGNPWYISFQYGLASGYRVFTPTNVRCVRTES